MMMKMCQDNCKTLVQISNYSDIVENSEKKAYDSSFNINLFLLLFILIRDHFRCINRVFILI